VEPLLLVLTLVAVAAAFAVSAAAGFGGSLVLVPALALVLGTKDGVALAALLLAGNNVVKAVLYRKTLPFRASAVIIVLVALGAALGARLLVAAPEDAVAIGVLTAFAATFVAERRGGEQLLGRVGAPLLAFASGATSGFSGTSGPLKGVAVRSLRLDRAHLVGALSLASLAGDAAKATTFTEAGLLDSSAYRLAALAVPLMLLASLLGRRVNQRLGERGFTRLFWGVMVAYAGRLVLTM
jgi:hypothetical protein